MCPEILTSDSNFLDISLRYFMKEEMVVYYCSFLKLVFSGHYFPVYSNCFLTRKLLLKFIYFPMHRQLKSDSMASMCTSASSWQYLYFTESNNILQFSSVHLLSHVQLFVIPWIAACQASLSITTSRSLLRLMSIESMMQSSHLILCHPFLLLLLIPPSIRIFSNESTLHMRWPK